MTVDVTAQQSNPDGTPDGGQVTAETILVCHVKIGNTTGYCAQPALY